MTRIQIALLLAVLLTCLTGCGQAGDLYLPDRKTPADEQTDTP